MAKRILIVDDSQELAGALAAVLEQAGGGDWEVDIAASSVSALARLGSRTFDVVIAGLRLGGVGGALLATIAAEYPDVVRFGWGDREVGRLRAAVAAHQIVPRAATPAQMADRLHRTFALRDALGSSELRAIVGHLTAVPTLPALYTAVITELSREHTSGRRIGEMVADDPAVAAKILQMVNSPFFGLEMRVSDPVHAVQLLGLDAVRGLIVSAHVLETFRRPARGLVDIERLWRHAVSVGALAGALAEEDGCATDVVQEARTGGLLHDIGKLVLVATLPVVATRILQRARRETRPMFEVEREELGVTHAELGAYLLGLWHLPSEIVEITAWHHAPRAFAADSALGFVIAADMLDAEATPRAARTGAIGDLRERLAAMLEPVGLAGRAAHWIDWTLDAAARAA